VVNITFKNVGQGDSIIIEWKSKSEEKTAIIDCNIFENTNPVLNHIITNNVKEIEFIILSHPHLDHFSGMYDLIDYCITHNILIKKFLHTSQITPDYLKSATKSIVAEDKLLKLFTFLKEIRDKDLIQINTIEDNSLIKYDFNNGFFMEILSPSSIEIDKFIRGVNYPFDEEESSNNPNANWLSTIIKIYNNNITAILTSDAESSSFTRIGKKKYNRIGDNKICLAQFPHHGAKGNLNKPFWSQRKRKEITPIVVSVGTNGYNHPSDKVIDFFNKVGNYKLYRTDFKIISENKNATSVSQLLDTISVNITAQLMNNNAGDIIFTLKENTCIRV